MNKEEKINIDKLVSERGDEIKAIIDKWYEQIPKDNRDKPIMASLSIDSKVLTPNDLYKELTKPIARGVSVREEHKGLLKEIIMKYGEGKIRAD